MFCSECGAENKTGKFCSRCGTPLKRDDHAAQVPAPPAPPAPAAPESPTVAPIGGGAAPVASAVIPPPAPKKRLNRKLIMWVGIGVGAVAVILVAVLVVVPMFLPFSLSESDAKSRLLTPGDVDVDVSKDTPTSAAENEVPFFNMSVDDCPVGTDLATMLAGAESLALTQLANSDEVGGFSEEIFKFDTEGDAADFLMTAKKGFSDDGCVTYESDTINQTLIDSGTSQEVVGAGGAQSAAFVEETEVTSYSLGWFWTSRATEVIVQKGSYVLFVRGWFDTDGTFMTQSDVDAAIKKAISKMLG